MASPMDLELIVTPGLGNVASLLSAGRDAVVVDPPRDAWRVIAAAEARGWRITHVVETHVHNDYLSGALELRSTLGAEIVAPARGRYGFAHRPTDDGDALEIDGLRLTARATPGHTPEHLAWDIATDDEPAPTAIATGGSLLVGSAGRTDLLGADRTDELTRAQFRIPAGARRAARRRDRPADARSRQLLRGRARPTPTGRRPSAANGRPTRCWRSRTRRRSARPCSTGSARIPPTTGRWAPINRAGPVVMGKLPDVPAIGPDELRAAVADGAHVVDGRSREAFAAGHIGGSLNIELTESFASYAGWFVPFGAAVVLVLPDPFAEALEEAVTQLFRIGYERIVGALDGGVAAWADAGGSVSSYPVTTAAAVADEVGRAMPTHLLDVRYPQEWRDEGAVPGAIELSIGDLAGELDTLPRDAPITVMCKSGARASVAASMLDAAGFGVRLVTVGGAPDIAGQTTPADEGAAAKATT